MRISTRTIFESGTSQLGTLQSQMARTQMQLSTNKRILTPSDDPIASARALEVTQSKSVNEQFGANRDNARNSLVMVEQSLGNATNLLQDVKTMVVRAGNAALSNTDLKSIADEIEGRMEDLLGIANSSDGSGDYLFSGYKTSTQPFTRTAAGAEYNGDQGARELQVSTSRKLPVSDSGASVFLSNATGNGRFETRADPGNAARGGTGVVSTGTSESALTNHDYSISFTVTPAGTTYTVTDDTLGAVVGAPDQPFKTGEKIAFDGVALDIKGAPANGDKFTVEPSEKRSVFESITELVSALRAGKTGDGPSAAMANALNKAHENIGNSIDNVLSVRSSVGSRLNELDYLDSAGDDLDIQYSSTLSELQDLDMVKAITEFTQQQFALEAAQKSFKAMSGLSLFNFIG